jgi:chromosome partitioning protein
MQVITVSGLKGGSGKTTTAVNVACALASKGRRVLLLDCDPQGSATAWAEPGALPIKVVPLPIDDERQWGSRHESDHHVPLVRTKRDHSGSPCPTGVALHAQTHCH